MLNSSDLTDAAPSYKYVSLKLSGLGMSISYRHVISGDMSASHRQSAILILDLHYGGLESVGGA